MTRPPDFETQYPCRVWVLKDDIHKDPAPPDAIVTQTAHPDIFLAWQVEVPEGAPNLFEAILDAPKTEEEQRGKVDNEE